MNSTSSVRSAPPRREAVDSHGVIRGVSWLGTSVGVGLVLASRRSVNHRLAMALGLIAGGAALDVLVKRRRKRHDRPVIATVTINKSPREVYEFYRRLDQLPSFMAYLASVVPHGERRSTWTVRLPLGKTVSWEAEITEDRPGEVLAWRSVEGSQEGSQIDIRGRVTFTRTPGRDMTEVRVELKLGLAGGRASSHLARLFARPQIKGDLRRLKQVLETGEVLYSDASRHRLPHPAQPSPARPTRSPELLVKPQPAAVKGVTR